MPLSAPPFSPIYVALECNTAPVNGTDSGYLHWDTFYDRDGNDLSGVLPAGIGFTISNTRQLDFTIAGIYSLTLALNIEPAPGNPATCAYALPGGSAGHADFVIPDPNTLGYITETRVAPFAVGAAVHLAVAGTAADEPVSYAVLEVTRLSA